MRERILYKLNGVVITALFIFAIFVPFTIAIIEDDNETSVVEKRKFTSMPAVTF